MKGGLRQSMAWLHTWLGLVVGWVLYYVYLTGTLGYFDTEIDRWMMPEKAFIASIPTIHQQLDIAQARLEKIAPEANSWNVTLIAGRETSSLDIVWAEGDANNNLRARQKETLDPHTGDVVENTARVTGGGQLLYKMHYNMAYLPLTGANIFIEICSLIMFIAMITGIIVHKKIFKDFFTFRPSKGQRSWLDAHNLLSVTSLPFHLMVTYSGLLFFVYIFMPAAPDYIYQEEGSDAPTIAQLYQGVYGAPSTIPDIGLPSVQRSETVALSSLLEKVDEVWGSNKVSSVNIEYPNLANARITFKPLPSDSVAAPSNSLIFDGVSGELIEHNAGPEIYYAGKADQVLKGLHKGLFSGWFLRVLYFLMGLAGTAMIGSGLLLWSTKRKQKSSEDHFGIVLVDHLNLSTIIGLPIAIAAYFIANRLLPVDFLGRENWEVHAMYFTLAIMFIYPIWKPLDKARMEMLWMGSVAYLLIPVVNFITTQRHLFNSVPQGDWVMAGFDLSALACSFIFAFYAWSTHRDKQAHVSRNNAKVVLS